MRQRNRHTTLADDASISLVAIAIVTSTISMILAIAGATSLISASKTCGYDEALEDVRGAR